MSPDSPPERRPLGLLGILRGLVLHVILPLAVLGGGVLVARHWIATAPQTQRKPRPRSARTVEVVQVHPSTQTPQLEAMGLVRPAREVRLRARVPGRVETVADRFAPGGRFEEDDVLLSIEKQDFELATVQAKAKYDQALAAVAEARTVLLQARATESQRRASLAEAESNLRLEEGQQAIAKREYEMLGGSRERTDPGLVLREPQLAIAKASVASARAGIEAAVASVQAAEAHVEAAVANARAAAVAQEEARLDEIRTELRAPFNAWIRERYVEVGAILGASSDVATLIGTDEYWIEVTLPVSDLQWLRLPGASGEGGARVRIRDAAAWGEEPSRDGRLLRLLGDLEAEGRLARLLVQVDDPLHLTVPPGERRVLLSGAYVRVAIDGRSIDDVFALDRAWIRHGDVVWVVAEDDTLAIRPISIRWRGREQVFVNGGLAPGTRIVTTDLGTPVAGMPLKIRGSAEESESP